jgi:mono/diheme cytochrome c family protein
VPHAAKTFPLLAIILIAGGMQAIEARAGNEPEAVAPVPPELEPAKAPLDGAQLFTTHCAMCHQRAALARRLQMAPGPEGANAKLASFLAHHSRSDAAANAAIIDYLATPSATP